MPVTRACDHCGQEFTRPLSGMGKYCSKSCGYAARRKPDEDLARRRLIYKPQHPLADAHGSIKEHRFILYEAVEGANQSCHWCGKNLIWRVGRTGGDTLIVDHIDYNPKNNDLSNLVPSCQGCNIHRDRPIKAMTQHICMVCNDTFETVKSSGNANKYCSRACMYARNDPDGSRIKTCTVCNNKYRVTYVAKDPYVDPICRKCPNPRATS